LLKGRPDSNRTWFGHLKARLDFNETLVSLPPLAKETVTLLLCRKSIAVE
jgi:hypothetical protein